MSTTLTQRTSFPVTVGSITLWCSRVKAQGKTVYSEAPTVSGDTLITNRLRRFTEITLTGRVYSGDGSLVIVSQLDSLIKSDTAYSTEVQGLLLSGCRVCGYTAEDNGGAFIDVTLLLTAESITGAGGGQE